MDPRLQSLFRLVILVAASAAHRAACTPPPAAKDASNVLKKGRKDGIEDENNNKSSGGGDGDSPQENILHDEVPLWLPSAWLRFSKYSVWAVTLVEGASRLMSIFPSSRLSSTLLPVLLPNHDFSGFADSSPRVLISPLTMSFVLGTTSVILGWAIRKACFDTLGRHFTFTHTTLSGHALVTNGPYSIVRHPGYVGIFLVRAGAQGMLLSSGGWVRIAGAVPWTLCLRMTQPASDLIGGVLFDSAKVLVAMYMAFALSEQMFLYSRASREDKTLQDRFGAEWKEYRKRVPWMFIPYIM
ncbi:hypothetical protein DFH11DRAFT_1055254 [Phellopilus nigrolimitatus]|nr:hypothetical protein DFH11DRAFT_1055254 [Phellopilus nigrolimitatus]